jgi:peptide/nickel transport system permease protein
VSDHSFTQNEQSIELNQLGAFDRASAAEAEGHSPGFEQGIGTNHPENLDFLTGRRKKLGIFFWFCTTYVVVIIVAAIFAPWLHIQNPNTAFVNGIPPWSPPSAAHWFGTDDEARDIFARIIYGARVSLEVGFGAILIGFTVGGFLGMVAAYRRGVIDFVLTTIMYIILSMPGLIVVIAILNFWTPRSTLKIILIIGVTSIPLVYRVIRSSALSVGTRDFILAAKVQGATTKRIVFREILPNIMPIALSFILFGVAAVIVLEGGLAFLNLSVPPPTPSWGNMILDSSGRLPESQYLLMFTVAAIVLFLLSLNFIGDRLRAYFDIVDSNL